MAVRRKKAQEERKGSFVVLMAALSMILLSFFILLNSMATLDNTRKRLALGSLTGAFGILPEGIRPDKPSSGMQPGEQSAERYHMPSPPITDQDKSFHNALKDLGRFLIAAGLSDKVKVSPRESGLEVAWASDLLFAPGSAEVEPAAYPLLDKLAILIVAFSHDAVIEGHTDNTPVVSRRFSSNWELSAARAANIMRYLVSQRAVPVERLMAVGYGGYRPLVPNRTPEQQARNRRVSMLLVNP